MTFRTDFFEKPEILHPAPALLRRGMRRAEFFAAADVKDGVYARGGYPEKHHPRKDGGERDRRALCRGVLVQRAAEAYEQPAVLFFLFGIHGIIVCGPIALVGKLFQTALVVGIEHGEGEHARLPAPQRL